MLSCFLRQYSYKMYQQRPYTEHKVRLQGASVKMSKFEFLCGTVQGDKPRRTLQLKSLSAKEDQQVAQMTADTIKPLQSDE